MTPTARRRQASQIRRLLTSEQIDDVQQGVEILRALGDPELLADFARGLSIQEHKIAVAPEVARRPHLQRSFHQLWIALALLRATGGLGEVERLDLGWGALPDLSPLVGLPALRALSLTELYASPRALFELTELPALESLEVGVEDRPAFLSALTGLRRLVMQDVDRIVDLSPIGALTGLESLEIRGVFDPVDLSPLGSLSGLRALALSCVEELGIDLAASMPALESLVLDSVDYVDPADLGVPSLRRLTLTRCSVESLSGLRRCPDLESLTLLSLGQLEDVSALRSRRRLRELEIWNLEEQVDWSPLASLLRRGALAEVRVRTFDPGGPPNNTKRERFVGAEAIRGWLARRG